jgi:hypothetical protein
MQIWECLSVPPLFCFCFLFVASTTTYGEDNKKLHRKLKIEQHETLYQPRINSGFAEEWAVSAPLVLCWVSTLRQWAL